MKAPLSTSILNSNPQSYFSSSVAVGNVARGYGAVARPRARDYKQTCKSYPLHSYVRALTQHVEYLPFGEPLIEQRATAAGWQTDRLFNSKEYDAETGFYYYGARYYDPRLAIWLSPDPLQEHKPGITSYHYVSNNPSNRIDPNGLTDYIVNDTPHNIPDGHNNLVMSVNQYEYYQLALKFMTDKFDYESLMNEYSRFKGYATTEYVSDDESTSGISLEYTYHRPKSDSYSEWTLANMYATYNCIDGTFGYLSAGIGTIYSNAKNIAIGSNNKIYFRNYNTKGIFRGNKYVKVTNLSNVKTIGNLNRACIGIAIGFGAYEVYQGYQLDNGTIGYNTYYQGSKAAGGILGSMAGAKLGAYCGASVGAVAGVPGSIIFGLGCAVAGAYLGEEGASALFNYFSYP